MDQPFFFEIEPILLKRDPAPESEDPPDRYLKTPCVHPQEGKRG